MRDMQVGLVLVLEAGVARPAAAPRRLPVRLPERLELPPEQTGVEVAEAMMVDGPGTPVVRVHK